LHIYIVHDAKIQKNIYIANDVFIFFEKKARAPKTLA